MLELLLYNDMGAWGCHAEPFDISELNLGGKIGKDRGIVIDGHLIKTQH